MAVTDPAAIAFVNKGIRSSADHIAQFYYAVRDVNDLWEALSGDSDAKWAMPTVKDLVLKLGQRASWTYSKVKRFKEMWQAESIGTLIPNDAGELVHDHPDGPANGQRVDKPINAQDAFRVKQRMEEFINWFEADIFTTDALHNSVTHPRDFANWQKFLKLSKDRSVEDPGGSAAWKIAKDLADALRLNYEVTNATHLDQLLVVAINPGE